jgi:tetratricopeptide (TPR) repeat protein
LAVVPGDHPRLERLCRRVIAASPDPALRSAARVAAGRAALERGRDIEAARLCRQALLDTWGTGGPTELAACENLARVCLRQRRIYESLVLARRACGLAESLEESETHVHARLHLAAVLFDLGDVGRATEALSRAEDEVARLPAEARVHHRRNVERLRTEMALHLGALEAAFHHLDVLAGLPGSADDGTTLTLEARLLVEAGRYDEARDVLIRTAMGARRSASSSYERDLLDARCLLVLRGPGIARDAGCALLARLETRGREDLSPGRRMELAEELGRLLIDRCSAPVEARRAFDFAGAAALERMEEFERFLRALPQLQTADVEDRAILEDFRERFFLEHHELLGAVNRLFQEATPAARVFGGATQESQRIVAICAWCERLRGPEGVWIPFRRFRAPEGPVEVSHGICGSCYETVIAPSEAVASRRERQRGAYPA